MPSSVVISVKYDAPTRALRVVYVSGMVYEYQNVPEEVYTAMITAFAKGVFLNKHIKGKYEFRKIKA